ncbi:ABC transporter substrate-binding protein [Streptomyces sp. KL2]|uniref:ABC transporter substrate-binding protein n=1 Tax=Streptomyces sp. KL2 TaxID=3050126 RepID=UPI00397A9B5F
MRSVRGARTGRPVRGGRTAALGALSLLLALAGPVGCARDAAEPRRALTVLGPWTGGEQESFEELLDLFEAEQGVSVEYQGTTATREVLLSGLLAGDPPDVAVLPVLGDLVDYEREGFLEPLEEGVVDEEKYDGGPWLAQPAGMDERHWIPVKVDLKSIVWHEKGRQPDPSRADAERWCVGMGSDATSGWPGSDWIEDILLQQSGPDAYEEWAAGEMAWTDGPVVRAWRTWGEFMSGDGGRTAREALTTDHRGPEGGNGLLFGTGPGGGCELEHQGSFARHLYGPRAPEADFVPSPRLLPGAADRDGRDREVSADFAAMFRESPEAQELMRFLASLEAQRVWAKDEEGWARGEIPFFSAHEDVGEESYPAGGRDTVSRRIVRELGRAGRLCLDASDVMPPTIRRLFYEKALEFLADPGQDPAGLLQRIQEVQEESEWQFRQRFRREPERLDRICR